MKKKLSTLLISAMIMPGTLLAGESNNMMATLADSSWNGEKVPANQQCQKYKGHGQTPRIRVNNIPEGANALVVEYSDKTYKEMDNGGHGKIGYYIDKRMNEVTIPPVKGHTFDIPKSFFIVAPQQAPSWDKAGAYLPPCSGGKGNLYSALVKAVHVNKGKIDITFAKVEINLGTY